MTTIIKADYRCWEKTAQVLKEYIIKQTGDTRCAEYARQYFLVEHRTENWETLAMFTGGIGSKLACQGSGCADFYDPYNTLGGKTYDALKWWCYNRLNTTLKECGIPFIDEGKILGGGLMTDIEKYEEVTGEVIGEDISDTIFPEGGGVLLGIKDKIPAFSMQAIGIILAFIAMICVLFKTIRK